MNLLAADPDPGDPRRVAIEAARTADRLRSLSPARLGVDLPEGDTRAARARHLAQELADRTAELAGWPARPLPDSPDTAAGDVLAVCAGDLVEVLATHLDPDAVTRASADATARLIALRTNL